MTSRSLTSTTPLHCVSIIISAVVTGLATVNFGVLSIWINGSCGALTLVYHTAILILNWRRSRATPGKQQDATLKKPVLPGVDVKMPTSPSPTYSPPPYYESQKFSPNRRLTTTRVTIPSTTHVARNPIPSGAFYSIGSLFIITFLELITTVGLGMTVEVSIHGAKSLLPAESAKGMTFPWNMRIQKAQCTFLSVQLLLGLVVLAFCVKGRCEISTYEDERREEIEYGFASPESTHHPISSWHSNHV